jgi:hypothetical protein
LIRRSDRLLSGSKNLSFSTSFPVSIVLIEHTAPVAKFQPSDVVPEFRDSSGDRRNLVAIFRLTPRRGDCAMLAGARRKLAPKLDARQMRLL